MNLSEWIVDVKMRHLQLVWIFAVHLPIYSHNIGQQEVQSEDVPVWLGGLLGWYSLFFPSRETSSGVGQTCSDKTEIYQQGVNALSVPSALAMFDASGKIPDGLSTGNTYVLGSYEACVKINEDGLKGKYCKGSIRFRFNGGKDIGQITDEANNNGMDGIGSLIGVLAKSWQGLVWGLCVPDECGAADLNNHTNTIFQSLVGPDVPFSMYASFNEDSCFNGEKELDFDTVDVVYTSIMAIFLAIVFASTVRDLWKRYGPFITGKPEEKINWADTSTGATLVSSFSIYRNGSRLFDCTESSKSIRCLHGLRFFSMTWVIFGHGGLQLFINNTVGSEMIEKATQNIEYQVFFNAYLSVDTFFFLSGFLLCFVLLKELEKEGNHLLILFNAYLHRYLRLTPAYLAVIGFYATLRNKLFDYPPYNNEKTEQNCRQLWWKMILYIHTLFDGETTDTIPRDQGSCMPQAWYLSVDMQMFIAGPPIIFFLYTIKKHNMKIFLCASFVCSMTAILIPGILTWLYNFAPTDVLQSDKPGVELDQHNIIYKKPWSRAAPYAIGILLGFWWNHNKGRMPKLPGWFVISGWLITFTVGLLIEYGMFPYNKFGEASYSTLTALSYATLHRPVWSLCLCWVIVSCHAGYGGPINSLLSWPALIPLSRLTYSAYLVHYMVLDLFWHDVRPMYKDELVISWVYISNVVVSLAFAVVLALAVEIPVINLDKILLGKLAQTNKKQAADTKNIINKA